MPFTLTPAIKGQLTKAVNIDSTFSYAAHSSRVGYRFARVRVVFERHMPREQAKHAAKRYLRTLQLIIVSAQIVEAASGARTGRFTGAKPSRASVPKACDVLVCPDEEYVSLTFTDDGTPVVLHG